MRLRIEATQDELASKAEILVKAIADTLVYVAPDLSEKLEKAIIKDTVKSEHAVLRDIHKRTRKLYEERIDWMLKDINKVLDRSMAKGEGEPKEYVPEEEKPGPGDINPDTGEEIPEEEEEIEPEEDEEEEQ